MLESIRANAVEDAWKANAPKLRANQNEVGQCQPRLHRDKCSRQLQADAGVTLGQRFIFAEMRRIDNNKAALKSRPGRLCGGKTGVFEVYIPPQPS